jgi:hypothetical protein
LFRNDFNKDQDVIVSFGMKIRNSQGIQCKVPDRRHIEVTKFRRNLEERNLRLQIRMQIGRY